MPNSNSQDVQDATICRRQLRFYWLLDTSGGVNDVRAGILNEALCHGAEFIRDAARNVSPQYDFRVYAVQFNTNATWVTDKLARGVPGDEFEWNINLQGDGKTCMGRAIEMVAESLADLPHNAFKPVIVLVTHSPPTDDFDAAFRKLLNTPWGKAAMRLAVFMDRDTDLTFCRKFSHPEINPIPAPAIADLLKRSLGRYHDSSRFSHTPQPSASEPAGPCLPPQTVLRDAPSDESFDF